MKILKTFVLFCLFSLVAIGVRLLVFGRPGVQNVPGSIGEVVPEPPGVDPVPASPVVATDLHPVVVQENQEPTRSEFEGVQVVGYVTRGRRINLWLSDGRFLTERDEELTEVRKNYAVIDGRRVWFQRISPPATKGEDLGLKLLQDGQSGRADSPGNGPQGVAPGAASVVSPL